MDSLAGCDADQFEGWDDPIIEPRGETLRIGRCEGNRRCELNGGFSCPESAVRHHRPRRVDRVPVGRVPPIEVSGVKLDLREVSAEHLPTVVGVTAHDSFAEKQVERRHLDLDSAEPLVKVVVEPNMPKSRHSDPELSAITSCRSVMEPAVPTVQQRDCPDADGFAVDCRDLDLGERHGGVVVCQHQEVAFHPQKPQPGVLQIIEEKRSCRLRLDLIWQPPTTDKLSHATRKAQSSQDHHGFRELFRTSRSLRNLPGVRPLGSSYRAASGLRS
jgi:hypothetical protein